ncbi:unnamed protein product [Adineta ricciae]|uniref:KASH domain-containing protein n=1 Tax=Adineta ricciae TaxID=249248 RepID=A0A814L800_ADIRI|nr:unnamed protein product [Adineta ricciae]
MSEELICNCKGSLTEPFSSLNDLSVHHVSYNEFEKQYTELFHWCEKIFETITTVSSNALKYYEELYEQGLMRLRVFDQYADKLTERFPDLKLNINDKMIRINRQWNSLESRFLDYLDEDFDRILQDLHSELLLFEEWLNQTEEQLSTFTSIRSDDLSLEDFQYKLHQHTKLQDEIKSRNSRVSSIIEICERLRHDYNEQIDLVPFDFASDLENRWHQTWINSVEIQCKLEEKLKILRTRRISHFIHESHSIQSPTSFVLSDEKDVADDEEDDIIPFESSEYEKIPLTGSNTSLDSLYYSKSNSKRCQSPLILSSNNNLQSNSIYMNKDMARSKRQMSLNLLPINSPSTFYYSLTNINDLDDQINTNKKQKRTLSKLDVGYESEDETNQSDESLQPIFQIKTSQSDYYIGQNFTNYNKTSFTSLTHSLPVLEHNHHLPNWWRHSITSAYDTCSNPDIDISIEEAKKAQVKPSLLMYSKKYTDSKPSPSQLSPLQSKLPSNPASNSYDASAEYTDPEQSENDVDILSSDFNSNSPVHRYHNCEPQYYNRYKKTTTTTTTTTTTGYSSDVELETTTTPSEAEDQQQTPNLGEVSQMMKVDLINLPMSSTSDVFDSLNTIIMGEKVDGSEPCWDGYQNPLFYQLNSCDIDSMETTLKWEDQFLEMDVPNDSSSDNENYFDDNFNRSFKNIHGSSSSLTGGLAGNKELLDSDSDLDDFNYVLNETERQLFKARQSLEKKKRQQQFTLNDRNLRKYDEVLRTCETNIQCLQQILKNLHRSKNSRLNSTKAIEQLQSKPSDSTLHLDNTRHISLVGMTCDNKLMMIEYEELARIDSSHNQSHPWLNDGSLTEILRRINYELESEKESRQKISSYRSDILLAEEHLNEYRMAYFDSPSSSNIDEHLHSCRLALNQLTDKMDTYQSQLRTLSKMIENLIPIETQIEQKLTSCEYNNNYQMNLQDIQRLIEKYEQSINHLSYSRTQYTSHLHLRIQNHCESKLDLYKKMLSEFVRKSQSKHVSFDGSINLNNNNSSIFHTSSSSSSAAPLQYSTQQSYNQNSRQKKYRRTTDSRTTLNDSNQNFGNETANKQSSTTSYISDDCKVLYIETVVEVTKPVFYERTNETTTTTNTEYHHQIPQSTIDTHQSTNHYYKLHESSDDESAKPVNVHKISTNTTDRQRNKFQQVDSGIEYDRTSLPPSSSSSTIYTHQTLNNNSKLLFPPVSTTSILDDTSQSTLLHRLQSTKPSFMEDKSTKTVTSSPTRSSVWNRLKQTWLRSLLLGLLILFILFFVYFNRLDTCSKSTIVRTVFHKIICIENEGIPTI